jgi:hypothetical protein
METIPNGLNFGADCNVMDLKQYCQEENFKFQLSSVSDLQKILANETDAINPSGKSAITATWIYHLSRKSFLHWDLLLSGGNRVPTLYTTSSAKIGVETINDKEGKLIHINCSHAHDNVSGWDIMETIALYSDATLGKHCFCGMSFFTQVHLDLHHGG